jgi:hypothetical protein
MVKLIKVGKAEKLRYLKYNLDYRRIVLIYISNLVIY